MHVSRVGFHLRLHTTVSAIARTAKALRMNFFQFFLHYEHTQKLFFLSVEDEKMFLSMRNLFKQVYVHGSYLINMATDRQVHTILEKEILLAKRLEVSHYIVHPGSFEKRIQRTTALDRVAHVLNTVISRHQDLIFCVENTANPSALLGGTLEDLAYIQERINVPERFAFCIDTAHAHAAGYNLNDHIEQESFITSLKKYKFPIALIHLNDTKELCGSYIDHHAKLGTGIIGMDTLHAFTQHPSICTVPLLVESPELSFYEMKVLLNRINTW